MKKYKKLLLLMVCTGVIGSMTACGRNNNTDGADQTDTIGSDRNMNDATGGNNTSNSTNKNNGTNKNNTTNNNNGTDKDNTTNGTDRNNGTGTNNGTTDRNSGDGVIGDAIDDVREGVDDMADDVNNR